MYLIPLLALLALVGVFAVENEGTMTFHLLGSGWTLPVWVPTAVAVGGMAALLVLAAGHARLRARLREIARGRELARQRATIERLRDDNDRLREEVAALRGEARGAASAPSAPSAPEVQPVP